MKKKIKIIIISAAVLVVIGIGLVVLKAILSSGSNEKVLYTANVETYENGNWITYTAISECPQEMLGNQCGNFCVVGRTRGKWYSRDAETSSA